MRSFPVNFNVISASLLILLGCAQPDSEPSQSGSPASETTATVTDESAGVSIESTTAAGHFSKSAPRGICLAGPNSLPSEKGGKGIVPGALEGGSVNDGWLAAGSYQLVGLTAFVLSSPKGPGKAHMTVANYKLASGWTPNAPESFSTQFVCGVSAGYPCFYSLKVGNRYGLILRHVSLSDDEGYSFPVKGTYAMPVAEGIFSATGPDSWSNAVSGGGIGVEKPYTLSDIQQMVTLAITQTQANGYCTVGVLPDNAKPATAASGPKEEPKWPMPQAPGPDAK